MVYRLSDYSYSFVQRFQELALPYETLQLQRADVDQVVIKKPKEIRNYRHIYFTHDSRTTNIDVKYIPTNRFEPDLNPPPGTYFPASIVTNVYLPLFHTDPKLKQFVFHPSVLHQHDSVVDQELIDMCRSVEDLYFTRCTFNSDVSIWSIVKACPQLRHLRFITCKFEGNIFNDLKKAIESKSGLSILFCRDLIEIMRNGSLSVLTTENYYTHSYSDYIYFYFNNISLHFGYTTEENEAVDLYLRPFVRGSERHPKKVGVLLLAAQYGEGKAIQKQHCSFSPFKPILVSMVYRLFDYSYSFVQRFQELALPTEILQLQSADVDKVIIKKPKEILKYTRVWFNHSPFTNLVTVSVYQKLPNGSHMQRDIIPPGIYTADKVDTNVYLPLFYTNALLKQFAFHPLDLTYRKSVVDQAVVNMCGSCEEICFSKNTINSDVSICSILKAAPQLKWIDFKACKIGNIFSNFKEVFTNRKSKLVIRIIFCDFVALFRDVNLRDLLTDDYSTSRLDIETSFYMGNIRLDFINSKDDFHVYLKPFVRVPLKRRIRSTIKTPFLILKDFLWQTLSFSARIFIPVNEVFLLFAYLCHL